LEGISGMDIGLDKVSEVALEDLEDQGKGELWVAEGEENEGQEQGKLENCRTY
jgi:hypothetical protein